MALRELGGERTSLCVSSSIANWKKKIFRKFGGNKVHPDTRARMDWQWWRNRKDFTVFFGLYHWVDYLKLIWHRGPRMVFWCGADIQSLYRKPYLVKKIIAGISCAHVCENAVEQEVLYKCGIWADIRPMFFGEVDEFENGFVSSNKPHVYLNAHPERKQEYGVDVVEKVAHLVPEITFHIYGIKHGFHVAWAQNGIVYNRDYVNQPNVIYHGHVPEDEFNEQIRKYQASLRLNEFDGFGDVTAKSILLGQYPITRIPFEKIDCAPDEEALISLLKKLKYKKQPNYSASQYWRKIL